LNQNRIKEQGIGFVAQVHTQSTLKAIRSAPDAHQAPPQDQTKQANAEDSHDPNRKMSYERGSIHLVKVPNALLTAKVLVWASKTPIYPYNRTNNEAPRMTPRILYGFGSRGSRMPVRASSN